MIISKLVTAPSDEPVTLDQAKLHCRVDGTDEDTLIQGYIGAVRSFLDYDDGVLGRAIVTQTWDASVVAPGPDGVIALPVTPVQSLVSIKYFDTNNIEQTLDLANFTLIATKWEAKIIPVTGVAWPDTFDRHDAITVQYVAGFGDPDAVPEALKHAILLLVCYWYENRETAAGGVEFHDLPWTLKAILGPFKKEAFS